MAFSLDYDGSARETSDGGAVYFCIYGGLVLGLVPFALIAVAFGGLVSTGTSMLLLFVSPASGIVSAITLMLCRPSSRRLDYFRRWALIIAILGVIAPPCILYEVFQHFPG